MEVLQHEHPLTLIDLNPEYPRDEVVYDDEEELIMKQDFRCPCGRCGQEINFYHRYYYTCDQCDYSLHKLCAELPTTLRHESHRDHILILCQVLGDKWCMCQVYCATTSKEASPNAIGLKSKIEQRGTSAISKIYSNSEYPDLLHLPFPDQTDALNHFHGESESRAFETNLSHPFHRHPLTLVDTPSCNNDITTTPSSSRITTSSIHDSMKMVELVCNACIRPITNIPFYKCTASDDGCDFVLHAWCTRLPTKVKTMYYSHTYNFKLLPQAPYFVGLFRCYFCDLLCNGFVYEASECALHIDVHCALTQMYITHKSHPNHLLRKAKPGSEKYCRLCLSDAKKQTLYTCELCKFSIHSKCALWWPDTVSHKYDKHRLTLRYFPVENYNGDYFCEVCEEEFDPNGAFYHCDQCVQSMHPACCVSVPQKETQYTRFNPDVGVAQFDNIKFGDIYKFKSHPHVVSLCRGVESDGKCAYCGGHSQDRLILKCLQCKFAIDIDCAPWEWQIQGRFD
ncbi:zinc finger, PHD-type containing protein [Tanacetum coccineum]